MRAEEFMRRFLRATPYERWLMWLLANRIADIDRRHRDRAV